MMPTPPQRSALALLLLPTLVLGALSAAQAAPPQPTDADPRGEFARASARLMGTRFQIVAHVSTPSQRAALDEALNDVADLQARWSPWVPASDLARINAAAGQTATEVAPDTLALIERSLTMCRETRRAFDPTFFALSSLYDLRQADFTPPAADAIAARLPLVDCRQIAVDAAARTVLLKQADMSLHLGGNAKGTALDVAAKRLTTAGITRFVVDGGGDIVARGHGPNGPWRVGIQDPRGDRGAVIGMVPTEAGAIATSGDYERFRIVDGVRYHHIVDPRTGRPATGCRTATVAVPPGPHAGELADALATALCVLGPRQGFRALTRIAPGATAAMIDRDGEPHTTPGFLGWLQGATPPQAAWSTPAAAEVRR